MRRWVLLALGIVFWIGLAPDPLLAQGGSSDGRTTIHVVQRGETLYRIALAYGTSVEAIAQTNGMSDTTNIQVGQRLVIPSSMVNAMVSTAGRHVVQPGESLAHIALRYGSTKELVSALNSIVNPARLYVGQVLDVSETTPGRPPLTHGYTHVVQPEDTLYRIALRYNARVDDVLLANGLSSPALIFPGQQLLIPGPDAPALQELPAPLTELTLMPLPAEVGRTFRLRVVSYEPVTPGGTFLDRPLRFAPQPDGLTFDALIGVQAMTPVGRYPLTLTIVDDSGVAITFETVLYVADGGYASEALTVSDELLDPEVDSAEIAFVAGLVSEFTPERYFDGPMGLPAAAPVTSPFGTRRSYNGSAYNRFHTGTDFGGPPGSSIYAPAAGRVVFSGPREIHGLFTVIDHGWGIYTAYAHQAESRVQPGQMVSAGEVIGTIGNSGRSTGPHLHWEVWVNGVETDGLQWTRLSFP